MYSPCGNIPKEVIHITLQDLFWVLSILWLICQIIDWFRNGKSEPSVATRRLTD